MNRWAVFNGYIYYPRGGWQDFKGAFETLEEAEDFVNRYPGDWWQIVDLQEGQIEMEQWS